MKLQRALAHSPPYRGLGMVMAGKEDVTSYLSRNPSETPQWGLRNQPNRVPTTPSVPGSVGLCPAGYVSAHLPRHGELRDLPA